MRMMQLKLCTRFSLALLVLACGFGSARAQVISTIINNSSGLAGMEWIGLAGDQVIITGNSFTAVSHVWFNGILSPYYGTTTANTITAYVPSDAANSTNFVEVRFSNGTRIFSPQPFIVPPSGPYVTSFAPAIGNAGTRVTLLGSRFSGVTAVRFKGITNEIAGLNLFKSETSIEVDAPPGVVSGPLTVVSNAFTHVTASSFFVPPVITSFSPTNGRAGTNVLIQGTNFLGTTAVQFGALNAASFTVLSTTQLTAVVPGAAVNGKIAVSAPAGTFMTTNSFVILPTLSGFTPTVGAPGTVVTLTGANLNEGSGTNGTPEVRFNGVPSVTVSNVSFGQLSAVVPNGATTGRISVTTTNGSGTNDALFYLPPKITGFTPSTNPPGTRIMITGTNFTGASAVTFTPGVASLNFTVTNDSIIGAEVPFGISTGPVSVTAPAGTGVSSANYFAPPSVSSFTPPSGLPGLTVRVNGSSFQGATAVRFTGPGGPVNAPLLTQTSSYIDVFVPTNAITGPVSVVAPGGVGTSLSDFLLLYPTLLITGSDTPDPVNVGSTLSYTLQVMNFGPGNAENVILTNVLPAGVTFVNASLGTTVGGVTTASLGTLGFGGSAGLTITAIVNAGGGTLTNTTTARSGLNPVPASTITTTTTTNFPAELSIAANPDGTLGVAWPLAASNYTLQSRTNLTAGAGWTTVSTPPATNGNYLTVTLTNLGGARFYQLKP